MQFEIHENKKTVIGVIQLLPLPGSLNWEGNLAHVAARAEQEAATLTSSGVDAILVENSFGSYWDASCRSDQLSRAGAAAFTLILQRIRHFSPLPLGITVRPNDAAAALELAFINNASFLRIPLLLGVGISDTGLMEGGLGGMLSALKTLHPTDIPYILTDLSLKQINMIGGDDESTISSKSSTSQLKQHMAALESHPLTREFLSGFIVSEKEASPDEVKALRQCGHFPLLVGEALSPQEILPYYTAGDGVILSQGFKKNPIPGLDPRTTMDLGKLEHAMIQIRAHEESLRMHVRP